MSIYYSKKVVQQLLSNCMYYLQIFSEEKNIYIYMIFQCLIMLHKSLKTVFKVKNIVQFRQMRYLSR